MIVRKVLLTAVCVSGLWMACADDPPCESTRRPVVLVHGFLASGDTWANHAMRLESNGYCLEDVVAFDWNTLGSRDAAIEALDRTIDAVLQRTGADAVDLAGHSAGGGVGYAYLEAPTRAAKVARYAHIGSFVQEAPAGPEAEVPTLNLWSEDDLIIAEKGDIPGATNVRLDGADHYAVATSPESFTAIFRHFNDGEEPTTTAIREDSRIRLRGRALTLGDNEPLPGARVEIFEVDPQTAARRGKAKVVFTADAEGRWGPFEAKKGARYEFVVQGEEDEAPVHYYRETFVRSQHLVYLRTLPPLSSLAGAFLSGVRFDDEHAVVVVFSAARGLLAGVDSLKADGREVLTEATASREDNTIALFLFDADGDGKTSGQPVEAMAFAPFLSGMDVMISTTPSRAIPLELNGRRLAVRNWRSASEGPSIAVFD